MDQNELREAAVDNGGCYWCGSGTAFITDCDSTDLILEAVDFTPHLLWTQCGSDECGGISPCVFVLRDDRDCRSGVGWQ